MGPKRDNAHFSPYALRSGSEKKPKPSSTSSDIPEQELETLKLNKATKTAKAKEPQHPPTTRNAPQTPASKTPLVPPHIDGINEKFDINVIQVANWAKIQSKVRHVLGVFKNPEGSSKVTGKPTPAKPKLAMLVARGPAANKCISVTEICKRELSTKMKVYQYTGYWLQIEHYEKKAALVDMSDGEEEQYFEPVTKQGSKIRNESCLVIYLSPTSIPKLQSKYGEQICEVKS